MPVENSEAVYQYQDEVGAPLFEVIRNRGKKFLQRQSDGNGGHIWNLNGIQRVIYRLPEVARVDQVYLVEGEKDVETLRALDLVATTNPGGANGWRPEFARFFAGKQVIVLPDQDKPGHGWAERILNDLMGTAASIKLIDLPGLEFGSGEDITDWLAKGHTKKDILALVEQAPLSQPRCRLPEDIDTIRKQEKRFGFEKKRAIAMAVLGEFFKRGCFYRGTDGRLFFFSETEHRLYRIDSDEFSRLLAETSWLNHTETEFKYTIEEITTHTRRKADVVEVYQIGHLDITRRKLYVSDLDGGIFAITEAGISHPPSGTDGVLFESFPATKRVQYVSEANRRISIEDFLGQINFDNKGRLTVAAYRTLLLTWMYSVFVPELNRTRVIPLFVGPQGSGKTTCARRVGAVLLGNEFNVGHLESGDRGEQAFVAAVCGTPFLAFDNADANIAWLADALARFATGTQFNLRQLYKTNELATFRPIANLVMTSRDPQFRRPDVAERLLIFPLRRLEAFRPEASLHEDLLLARDSIFSAVLDGLRRALPHLIDSKSSVSQFRMADFAEFGRRIMAAEGLESEFEQCLKELQGTQASYATENEPLIELLAEWIHIPGNSGSEIETGLLFSELERIATGRHLMMPKSASALGRKLRDLETVLEQALGAEVDHSRIGNTTRWAFSLPESESFPNSDSPDSSDSTELLSAPPSQIAEMSEMSQIPETSVIPQNSDGKWQCPICKLAFASKSGCEVHVFREHGNFRGEQ